MLNHTDLLDKISVFWVRKKINVFHKNIRTVVIYGNRVKYMYVRIYECIYACMLIGREDFF